MTTASIGRQLDEVQTLSYSHGFDDGPFYGCRPLCKMFLTLFGCDRVRSSIRPFGAALFMSAGRYGDQRSGSKSTLRDHRL